MNLGRVNLILLRPMNIRVCVLKNLRIHLQNTRYVEIMNLVQITCLNNHKIVFQLHIIFKISKYK